MKIGDSDFSNKWNEVVKDKQITKDELTELKNTAKNTDSVDDDKLVEQLEKMFSEGQQDTKDIKTIVKDYKFKLNLEGTFNLAPNYDNPNLYLKQNDQTHINISPKEKADKGYKIDMSDIAPLINNDKDLCTVEEIFNLVHALAPGGRPDGATLFETSALDVLNNGYATGCTNFAVAFAAVAREKGIPAIVVNSAGKEWIGAGASADGPVQGHYFVELYAKDDSGKQKWFLCDTIMS